MTVGVHTKEANSGASAAITTGTPVTTTAGSTVVVFAGCISDDFAASNPLTDSKSNSWTPINSPQDAGGTHSRAWYSKIATAGSGHTFTINLLSAAYCCIFVVEILDGASTPNVLSDRQDDTDGTPFSTATGVSPSTSAQLLGFARPDVSSGTDTHTWAGSFAAGDKLEEVTDANSFVTGSCAVTSKSAGGPYNSQITTTSAPTDVAVWVVSVDLAAGGGGGTPDPRRKDRRFFFHGVRR